MRAGITSLVSLLALLICSGCSTLSLSQTNQLHASLDNADASLKGIPQDRLAYNSAVRSLVEQLQDSDPEDFSAQLKRLAVAFEFPKIGLPIHHVEVPPSSANSSAIGVPVVIGYDTRNAPLYPPEGLFADATAVYRHVNGHRELALICSDTSVALDGHTLPLAFDATGASRHLKSRARRLASSGFASMLRPESMVRKPQIYLLEPYDPNKTPLLMVHGLQSTPVAFATLVDALRSDPEIRRKFQIWQFYYPSGTPVLANAAALRKSLEETLAQLDPQGIDQATRRLVVIGHSMGV